MLGVKTVGNATLIAYDGKPVLATDPWLGNEDDAYFGSWRLSHDIPSDAKADIAVAPYIWVSHGHPDHLNGQSLKRFINATILLPDHVGGRIHRDLEADGYKVRLLPDGEWIELSKRIRVLCISDYIQDAVLLVDVGGRLFINMNDSGARARLSVIQKIARNYRHSYLLRLSGYGDADMINMFDEEDRRIEFKSTRKVGRWLSQYAARTGAKYVIPFSSFHQYQREDSGWANAHLTPVSAYQEGFDGKLATFIEPFVWVDCVTGEVAPLDPPRITAALRKPEEFGDSWSDELDKDDKAVLADYFLRKEALREKIGFLRFNVGGKQHTIGLNGPSHVGITFAVPRNSLMTAVTYRVFDDLLIGNFMKTTLHGMPSLYAPNFNFFVAKYGDNGGAESKAALRSYLAEYRRRSGAEWFLHILSREAPHVFRRFVRKDGRLYAVARDVYNRTLRK
jgi:hypothetical protein